MPRPRPRSRLGEAIFRARKAAKLSQEDLGEAVDLPQPRVSDWEGESHQEVEEALDLLGRIDLALGHPRGWLLAEAGYVEREATEIDVRSAIANSHLLDTAGKELVLMAWDYGTATSALANLSGPRSDVRDRQVDNLPPYSPEDPEPSPAALEPEVG